MWTKLFAGMLVSSAVGTGLHFAATGYVSIYNTVRMRVDAEVNSKVDSLAHALGYARPKPQMAQLDAMALAEREALRHGINPALVKALLKHESGNNQFARSHAGAIGYMQIMPANAKWCGLKNPNELWDDETNIKCGTALFAHELEQTKGDVVRALRRYNGGPNCERGGCKESEGHWPAVLKIAARDISFAVVSGAHECAVTDKDRTELNDLLNSL